jgi:HPt (histidine-containing phosphotransfer) domain-containing protein
MHESTPPSPTPPVLVAEALEALGELVGAADPTLVPDIVATFLTDGRARLEALAAAAADDDHEAFRSIAHTLKSSSAHIGALRLSSVCAAIEALVDQGRVDEARARTREAQQSYEEVAAELRELYP